MYKDVYWVGCIDDRRSTKVFAMFFGNNLVSWSAKKKPMVAHSSTEVEFRILANATFEVVWVQNISHEIGFAGGLSS